MASFMLLRARLAIPWQQYPALGFALALALGCAGGYSLLCYGYVLRVVPLFMASMLLLVGLVYFAFAPQVRHASRSFAWGVSMWWSVLGLWVSALWQQADRVAIPHTPQTLMGIVTDIPRHTDTTARVTLTLVADSVLPIAVGRQVSVWLQGDSVTLPKLGQAMVVSTRWRENKLYSTDSTQQVFAAWQRRQGIVAMGFAPAHAWYVLPDTTAQRLYAYLAQTARLRLVAMEWRARLAARYATLLRDTTALAIAQSITLGERSLLTPRLKQLYATAGASHVLALSGLHLGILYAVVMGLLALLPLSRGGKRGMLFVALACLWGYAWLVGFPISVVRSVLMFSLMTLARWRMEDGLSLNNLGWAAVVVLLLWPSAVADVGFQLSFMAVLGILVGYPLLRPLRPRWPVVRWLFDALAVSACAQLAVAPLLAYHFHALPSYFLITNLLVALLVPLMLTLGFATLVVPYAPMVEALAYAFESTILCFNNALSTIATWPHSTLALTPSAWQVVLAYSFATLGVILARAFMPQDSCVRRTH